MKDLKKAFKETPERFEYTVEESLKEAKYSERKRSSRYPLKGIAAAALVVAMIPTSVFAATQIYSLVTKQAGKYAVDVKATEAKKGSSPKYVKLKVDAPKGFKAVFDDVKYHTVPETDGGYISLMLLRPKGEEDFNRITNVKSVKETEINGRSAVVAVDNDNPVQSGSRTVDVYYEDVNIILEAYIGADVTDKAMTEFLEGVRIVKGTKKNHTEYTAPENVDIDRADAYSLRNGFKEVKAGEKIKFDYGEEKYTASIGNIKVVDNVKGFDKRSFILSGAYDEFVNKDGSLKPRTRETWKWGDGVNTRDEKIKSEKVKQKFVLADITFTNTTDKPAYAVGTDVVLNYLTKSGNELKEHKVAATDPKLPDGMYQYRKGYISKDEKGDVYLIDELGAHESRTFTVGYFCDEDLLDNAYLSIECDESGQLVSKTFTDNYCSVKVRNDE